MKKLSSLALILLVSLPVFSQNAGNVIDLNGQWDFEQTDNAFPPQTFTRKCPVPGLIHLARPKIDSYEKLFKKPEQTISEEIVPKGKGCFRL